MLTRKHPAVLLQSIIMADVTISWCCLKYWVVITVIISCLSAASYNQQEKNNTFPCNVNRRLLWNRSFNPQTYGGKHLEILLSRMSGGGGERPAVVERLKPRSNLDLSLWTSFYHQWNLWNSVLGSTLGESWNPEDSTKTCFKLLSCDLDLEQRHWELGYDTGLVKLFLLRKTRVDFPVLDTNSSTSWT